MNGEQVERHLRYHITGLLHVGRLKRGVPLPSIRGVAASLGVDHRLVAAAYRALEAEGLVEIRRGAGVFLASDVCAAALQDEVEGWLSGVLQEGWSRGIPRSQVARLVDRCAAGQVRCACVESNEDHMVAVAAELEDGFSLDVRPVMVSPAASAPVPPDALAGADLVVTTVFHAAAVRAAAAQAGKPLVVLRVEPRFAARIAQVLNTREVTAVIADPRFSARALAYLEVTPQRGRVRFVLVDDVGGDVDLHDESTLITRAARRRLELPEYHLIPPPPGYISSESAGELCQAIVGLALNSENAGLS
ncbi:MAG TPA: GntR family transcriptional regulator [Longimicrobium sp.]|nr:GntR family transcriptional regulator [Longimicrobium sp.]